jgi:hypothetical protein
MRKAIICAFILMHASSESATILASSLSCGAPTALTGSTVIELDIPLVISGPGLCQLITAGGGFGPGDTVTFIPTISNTITITSTTIINAIGMVEIINPGIWDVRTFTQPTQRFIFQDIDIIMQPGGSILADGVTFQLKGTSKLITQPVALP